MEQLRRRMIERKTGKMKVSSMSTNENVSGKRVVPCGSDVVVVACGCDVLV